ncbi:hypothetical protein CPB83DRAFT_849110 [Crepidotus variabilis]|uniref:Uncharacterized protein n=1 Tax=Crepidotus variabilis TaxID=179855 RepID=A0A9P6ELT7_9AGAR|nr:hypothetical protein CPB83DRAFT_849110 [Crepidotus variabilis]
MIAEATRVNASPMTMGAGFICQVHYPSITFFSRCDALLRMGENAPWLVHTGRYRG